jgi:signal transduction histidine kinase
LSADDFLWLVNQAVLLAVALVVLVEAIRRPSRASVDIALFFGAIALVLLLDDVRRVAGDEWPLMLDVIVVVPVIALPYLLLRMTDDLDPQPRWLMTGAAAVLVLLAAGAVAAPGPLSAPLLVGIAVWFVVIGGYVARVFVRGARRSTGVTARRMVAAAVGTALLAIVIALAVIAQLVPGIAEPLRLAYRILTLGAGVAFFVGFATPAFLRRAWQEPELRAFLERAASLPRLQDTSAIIAELQRGAASSTGAPHAVIGLWDPERNLLVYRGRDGNDHVYGADEMIAGRAFSERRAIFSANAERDDPGHAQRYAASRARAVLAAPIMAGERPLGILCVYAERAPIFAAEDLRLVQLLADQAAVILESRTLIDEASRVRAREEATRLKDDFLSAAAHDLRTPLTTILIQAQMLERRLRTDPSAPVEGRRVETVVHEAMRLRTLVDDYLDAARAERGELVDADKEVDLVALVRQACARHGTSRHPCRAEASGPVIATLDPDRIGQLLDNLLTNAMKYSPDGGAIEVRVWIEGALARLSVSDQGIGIPSDDVPHLFDRFHRAANVDDRRYQGLGLGLYICRGIVEQHGGRIWATSELGAGSTFHVELPLAPQPEPAEPEINEGEPGADRSTAAEAGASG